jgi:hypothetical protein
MCNKVPLYTYGLTGSNFNLSLLEMPSLAGDPPGEAMLAAVPVDLKMLHPSQNRAAH